MDEAIWKPHATVAALAEQINQYEGIEMTAEINGDQPSVIGLSAAGAYIPDRSCKHFQEKLIAGSHIDGLQISKTGGKQRFENAVRAAAWDMRDPVQAAAWAAMVKSGAFVSRDAV